MTSSGPPAGLGLKPALHHPVQSEAVKERKDLASWWKTFKRSDKKRHDQAPPQGIFGIPLQSSIRYANVAISLFNDEGQSYIYGYVPIVVAKCGVFLKEKATDVEGIFRLAGSEKRIKELKQAFDSPDRYGKGLDWTGYTVHDAANILRRYFNQLPEPIIPLEFYQKFREPIRNHQAQAVGAIETQSPSHGVFDQGGAIRAYQALITELPPLNRQLLLYILDLLAVFASKSDLNKMTTPNLAAIFQPGTLNHPQHDMAPQEYRLSQDVLIFLIENQDSFLIGMQGTAADPETVREVQSGSPAKAPATPPTPSRSKTVIGRSTSSSSVAAESVRKWGSIRRNVSVSSKHSKRSEQGPPPGTPTQAPSSGVHRSNTVPSRRGGSAAQSPRWSRDNKPSDPPTPNFPHRFSSPISSPSPAAMATASLVAATSTIAEANVQTPAVSERQGSIQSTPTTTSPPTFPVPLEVTSASSSEATTPLATIGSDGSYAAARDYYTPKKDTVPLLAPGSEKSERSASNTPSTTGRKGFLDILKQSPHNDGEGRKPNKLQKRRIPGSALSSAQSSSQSLYDAHEEPYRSPVSPQFAPAALATLPSDAGRDLPDQRKPSPVQHVPVAQMTPQRNNADLALKPTISPSNSFQSHTDMSDADMVGDDMPPPGDEQGEKKKRNRWRIASRTQNKLDQPATPSNPLGTMNTRDQTASRSTVGSSGSMPRRSFQEPTAIASVTTEPVQSQGIQAVTTSATSDAVFSDSERERKGPMSWLRNKIQERKDKDNEKRSHTPERHYHERSKSRQDVRGSANEAPPVRGNSIEQPRIEPSSTPLASPASAMANQAPVAGLAETANQRSLGRSDMTHTNGTTYNGASHGQGPQPEMNPRTAR